MKLDCTKVNTRLVAPIPLKKNPCFESVVVFDFYDGFESGLAVYPDGVGVKFRSLGDSRSGLFRSFCFEILEGNWSSRANSVVIGKTNNQGTKVMIPNEPSEALNNLKESLLTCNIKSQFLGLGSPYFKWIAAFEASNDMVSKANKLGFNYIHQKLKN